MVTLAGAAVRMEASELVDLQDECTATWHSGAQQRETTAFETLVAEQHQANFALWHEEDKARDPGATDAEMVCVKHAIDQYNQRRNDLMEQIDQTLLDRVGEQNAKAPLSSESPGLMIDRLSILSLKIFHTEEETLRATATVEHRTRNAERLRLLREQRGDLQGCLEAMWVEVAEGRRRFKLYRQMKMYNDPELNPMVYLRKGC